MIDRLVTQMVNGPAAGDAVNVGAAAAVREVVDVPVIAVGRLHDPDLAEAVLAEGRADFVALGRPLLADPDLPRKLAAGQVERVRRCISCENCIDSLEQRFSTDCAVNPLTGREHELLLPRVPEGRHVVVVGGGPGGLESARLAAGHGHRVTLLERSDRLGGSFVWAAAVHPANAPYLAWLRAEVERASVDLRLGVAATAAGVAALEPDAVVVATGGAVASPAITGHRLREVCERLVAGEPLGLGHRVAIVGGGQTALELAVTLAAAGHRVSVLEPGADLAPEIGGKRLTELMDELDRLGVTVHVAVAVDAVEDLAVVVPPRAARRAGCPSTTSSSPGSSSPTPGWSTTWWRCCRRCRSTRSATAPGSGCCAARPPTRPPRSMSSTGRTCREVIVVVEGSRS